MLAPNESKGAEFSHSQGRKRKLLLVSLDVRCWSRRTGLGLSKGRAAHETEGGDSNNELPHLKLLFGFETPVWIVRSQREHESHVPKVGRLPALSPTDGGLFVSCVSGEAYQTGDAGLY
jgi:hypothetical protein